MDFQKTLVFQRYGQKSQYANLLSSPAAILKLSNLQKEGSAIKLNNCMIKNFRQSQGYDVLLKSNTQIKKSPRKFDVSSIVTLPTECKITLDQLPTLPQYQTVTVDVKVLKVFEAETGDQNIIKQDVVVADHTCCTNVVLWEDHIDLLQEGKCYNLLVYILYFI